MSRSALASERRAENFLAARREIVITVLSAGPGIDANCVSP
jgi:hypothetical protein